MRVKPVFKKLWRTSSAKVRYKVQYLDLHDPSTRRHMETTPEALARHSKYLNAERCEFPDMV
jgi:hypothetical protein